MHFVVVVAVDVIVVVARVASGVGCAPLHPVCDLGPQPAATEGHRLEGRRRQGHERCRSGSSAQKAERKQDARPGTLRGHEDASHDTRVLYQSSERKRLLLLTAVFASCCVWGVVVGNL